MTSPLNKGDNSRSRGGRIRQSITGEDKHAAAAVRLNKMDQQRQPSRILKRRTRSDSPATRTTKGVPAFFVGAYIPEDLHQKLITDAADNERTVSAQIIFLLKTHYLKPSTS